MALMHLILLFLFRLILFLSILFFLILLTPPQHKHEQRQLLCYSHCKAVNAFDTCACGGGGSISCKKALRAKQLVLYLVLCSVMLVFFAIFRLILAPSTLSPRLSLPVLV